MLTWSKKKKKKNQYSLQNHLQIKKVVICISIHACCYEIPKLVQIQPVALRSHITA